MVLLVLLQAQLDADVPWFHLFLGLNATLHFFKRELKQKKKNEEKPVPHFVALKEVLPLMNGTGVIHFKDQNISFRLVGRKLI